MPLSASGSRPSLQNLSCAPASGPRCVRCRFFRGVSCAGTGSLCVAGGGGGGAAAAPPPTGGFGAQPLVPPPSAATGDALKATTPLFSLPTPSLFQRGCPQHFHRKYELRLANECKITLTSAAIWSPIVPRWILEFSSRSRCIGHFGELQGAEMQSWTKT
eukprot:gene25020-biopygen20941